MIALILASTLAVAAPLLATADGDGWRLVAAYDAAPLLKSAPASGYLWRVPAGMEGSCGPAKMPMGLGKFEAEAVAQGLTPTLMLLLERRGPARELAPADVSLEIGDEGASVRLAVDDVPNNSDLNDHLDRLADAIERMNTRLDEMEAHRDKDE